ncbi:MAG: serine/threonine-protein kinase [Blastocatellia bacterium]
MTSTDWEKAKGILDAALQVEPADRAAILARECGEDAALRGQIEELLASHEESGDFLENPVLEVLAVTVADEPATESEGAMIGKVIGPYQVIGELGSGGMGRVYLAARADGMFRKKVAIKVMQTGGSEQAVTRFVRERQILAELEHPNIARLIDGGTIEGSPYIVMEYVEGRNLRELLRQRGALPLDTVIEITRQICRGLEAAHRHGVIHRDIKPENLIVSERAGTVSVKILDFGVAKPLQPDTGAVTTQTGVILGTAKYMSPEQAAGESGQRIDERSDLYSLGAVIYEMLTGEPVFKGDTYLSLINQHLTAQPESPARIRPDLKIPEAVAQVVLKALAKERDARQQSAAQLIEELETAERQGIGPRIPRASSKEMSSPAAPDRKALKKAAGVALIVLFAAIAWSAARNWSRSPAVAPPATPAPNRPDELRLGYRVIKKNASNNGAPLKPNEVVRKDDEIHFEVTMPFTGECYLFYEGRDDPATPADDSFLIWANPRPGQPPQAQRAGERLRVPESGWIPFDEVARKQNFLVVYVPENISWSLEDVIPANRLEPKTEEVTVPYVRIKAPDWPKLSDYLNNNAQLVTAFSSSTEGLYLATAPSGHGQEKLLFHRIVIWHAEEK